MNTEPTYQGKQFAPTKEFAPDYPRNDEGWIIFPDDVAYRKEMFPASVKTSKHTAKANIFMVQAIILVHTKAVGLSRSLSPLVKERDDK